ncbi:MAG: hypothetical protein JW852_06995, partial [Spirochaetales bacterium]|nr:hypothetical protein [Spirochaetales bacterium]
MKKTVFLTILIAAVFALLSCATTGEGDTGVGAAVQESGAQGVAVEEDNAQPADVTTGTDGSRTEGVTSGGEAGTLTEIEPTGTAVDRTEDSEPAANNAETAGAGGIAPIPFQPRVEPEAPLTGQEISIVLDASAYDAVTYDFGEGATERATYTYESFGVKTVTVSAVSVNASVSAQVVFPVRGNATLRVERNEAEHDVLWNPVLNAELDAGGDF